MCSAQCKTLEQDAGNKAAQSKPSCNVSGKCQTYGHQQPQQPLHGMIQTHISSLIIIFIYSFDICLRLMAWYLRKNHLPYRFVFWSGYIKQRKFLQIRPLGYVAIIIQLRFVMCQCVCCNCWWMNCCGVCAGLHVAELWCSCWLCKPVELMAYDPECCHFCQCDGLGSNFFCYGGVCCAPHSVKNWSQDLSARRAGDVVPPRSEGQMVVNNNNRQHAYMS